MLFVRAEQIPLSGYWRLAVVESGKILIDEETFEVCTGVQELVNGADPREYPGELVAVAVAIAKLKEGA